MTGTSLAYEEGVLWNNQFYGANETKINSVGKQIGEVQKFLDSGLPSLNEYYNQTVSNEFHVGTKIYEVPGKDPNKFIACQNPDGGYVEIEADSAVR